MHAYFFKCFFTLFELATLKTVWTWECTRVNGQRSITLRRNVRRRFKKLFSPRTKETFHPHPDSPMARFFAAYADAAENPRRAFLFFPLFTDTAAENKKKYVRSSHSIRIYKHVGIRRPEKYYNWTTRFLIKNFQAEFDFPSLVDFNYIVFSLCETSSESSL